MTEFSTFNEPMVISNALDIDRIQYADKSRLPGRLQFFALLVYLTCHAYTIPILPIGLSWAVWPRLDDFAFLILAFTWLIGPKISLDNIEKKFMHTMILVMVLSLVSVALITAGLFKTTIRGINFGIFQTARLLEYTMVWLFARNIIFDNRRLAWIRRTLTVVALFIIIVCLLNALRIVTPSQLVSHLPWGFERCGPWHYMQLKTKAIALGPLGYNPAYMAAELSLLTVMILGLRRNYRFFISAGLVAISLIVVFLSGSRAGLVIFVTAILVWSFARFRHFGIFVTILVLLVPMIYFFSDPMEMMMPRQAEIFSPGTAAGRTVIWKMAIEGILDNPMILLTGTGWGNTMVYMGEAAHNLYLHIILESGILGFVLFCALGYQVFRLASGPEELSHVFRAIFIGILIGALTQETLFPVASMGSFLGLFLCILGVVSSLRRTADSSNTEDVYSTEDLYDHSLGNSWDSLL